MHASPVAPLNCHAQKGFLGAALIEKVAVLAKLPGNCPTGSPQVGNRGTAVNSDGHQSGFLMDVHVGTGFRVEKLPPVGRHRWQTAIAPLTIDGRKIITPHFPQPPDEAIVPEPPDHEPERRVDRKIKIRRTLWLAVLVGQMLHEWRR